MKVLAFEASTARLSVALYCAGALAEKSAVVPNGGSGHLLPWAHALLDEAGLSLKQLDGLAFGAGPGGFTGLRLACGVAQGLACGLDLPVAPVGTLAALALESGVGQVLACLDARMNEIYLAAYAVDADAAREILPPRVGAGETMAVPMQGDWRGVGDGWATAHGEVLRQRLGARLTVGAPTLAPTASAVARLAAASLARGEGVDAARALPLYVRDKVALTTAERRARGGLK